jgi:hypothetical protein
MHILILNVTKPWKETGLKWMNYISGVNTGMYNHLPSYTTRKKVYTGGQIAAVDP